MFNEQAKNDYGVDGELQFFEGGNHTGNVFKVQIKSKKSLRFINNNTQISFKLDNNEIKIGFGHDYHQQRKSYFPYPQLQI